MNIRSYTSKILLIIAAVAAIAYPIMLLARSFVKNQARKVQQDNLFVSDSFAFGRVLSDERYKTKFKFTNVTTEPLILKSFKGSCGCVVGATKDSVFPIGKSGELEVTLSTLGQRPPNKMNRTIQAIFEGSSSKQLITKTLRVTAEIESPIRVSEDRIVLNIKDEKIYPQYITIKNICLTQKDFKTIKITANPYLHIEEILASNNDEKKFEILGTHSLLKIKTTVLRIKYSIATREEEMLVSVLVPGRNRVINLIPESIAIVLGSQVCEKNLRQFSERTVLFRNPTAMKVLTISCDWSNVVIIPETEQGQIVRAKLWLRELPKSGETDFVLRVEATNDQGDRRYAEEFSASVICLAKEAFTR